MIQTIILDLGGVLMQHDMTGCISKFKVLLGDNYTHLGLESTGEAVNLSVMHDYEIGRMNTNEFVEAILPLCIHGTTPAQVLDAWNTMHAGIPSTKIETVQYLAKRYPVYLLSNNNEAHWEDVCNHYPELITCFTDVFLSHELHMRKPDMRVFKEVDRRIANANRLYNKHNTLFVDDLEDNCTAARLHGWQTCLSIEELFSVVH